MRCDALPSGVQSELCSALCGCITVLTAGSPEAFSFSGSCPDSPDSAGSFKSYADAEADAGAYAGSLEAVMQALLRKLQAPAVEPEARTEAYQMLTLMLDADVPAQLLAHQRELGFEAQKDAMNLFRAALQAGQRLGAEAEIAAYVRAHPQVVKLLLEGCASPINVLHCGHMLRACAQNRPLVEVLLEARAVQQLAELAASESFEVSSDAFASLRELLLTHGEAASEYLAHHFSDFFGLYHRLVQVDDYARQRQALRLLGEVLLHSDFTAVMVKYVSRRAFLQIHMNLLRDEAASIKIGAFHLFKIFAANPNQPAGVTMILRKNRARLMPLLQGLIALKQDDAPLENDVRCILQLLGNMADLPSVDSTRALYTSDDSAASPRTPKAKDTASGRA
jgi:calcium binding protein 39